MATHENTFYITKEFIRGTEAYIAQAMQHADYQQVLYQAAIKVAGAQIGNKDHQVKQLQLLLEATHAPITVLHSAILTHNLELVSFIISSNPYKNLLNKVDTTSKATPLHFAILKLFKVAFKHQLSQEQSNKQRELLKHIISSLIQKGARWNINNDQYSALLYWFLKSNRVEILQFVLDQLFPEEKIAVAHRFLQSFFLKQEAFPLEAIDYLLGQTPLRKINKIEKGSNFLHSAIQSELPIKVIKKLLEQGADPKLSINLKNALHVALTKNEGLITEAQINTIQLLLEYADPELLNARDSKGNTPFHYVTESFGLTMVKAFLEKGSNILLLNNKRETPLHKAVYNRDSAIFSYLIKRQSYDLDQTDSRGNSYLHLAARHQKYHIIQLLLCAGAKQDLQNIHRKVPLQIAIQESIRITAQLNQDALWSLQTFIQYSSELAQPLAAYIPNRIPKRVNDIITAQVNQNKPRNAYISSVFKCKQFYLYARAKTIHSNYETELRTLTTLIDKPLPIEICSIISVYLTQALYPPTYQTHYALMTRLLSTLSKEFARALATTQCNNTSLQGAKRKDVNNIQEDQENSCKRMRIT